MEQSIQVKTLHHTRTCSKIAYIGRTNIYSEYDGQMYYYKWKTKEDLVGSDTLIPSGMDQQYKDIEKLINYLETDKVMARTDAQVCRDWNFSIARELVIKNNDGSINKEETYKFIKPSLDNFLKKHFVDDGYCCYYGIHFTSKSKEKGNLHVHVITLCSKYDAANKVWVPKTYKSNDGKYHYYSPLDQRNAASQKLSDIRKDFAGWQNKLLEEKNIQARVEYKSFKDRGQLDKIKSYHLSRYHWNEIEKLKKEFSYIEDIQERNEMIIQSRTRDDGSIALTRQQIAVLRSEYINRDSTNKLAIVNDAFDAADRNRSSGFINHEFKKASYKVLHGAAETLAKSAAEAQKGANKGMRGR